MESKKSIMKRKGVSGPYILLPEQTSSESPIMPYIKEQKLPLQHQVMGNKNLSPKDEPTFIKLPHIGKSLSEADPYNNYSIRGSKKKKKKSINNNYEGSEIGKSNSSNLNKQNSWNSNFSQQSSICSSESPNLKVKPSSLKGKDLHFMKQSTNSIIQSLQSQKSSKNLEDDPILRDLQASLQAENELKEIFSKKK